MAAPDLYIEWIDQHLGFNPRGQQNSDALSSFVTADLQRASSRLATDLVAARLKRELNAPVRTRITERDVDLVFLDPAVSGPINRVCLAVEHKTLMTAHGKARKNRYGDVIAYANHLHNHSPKAIAGAVVVINVSPIYRNPNGFATEIERNYPNMPKIVADTVRIFTGIPLREREDEPNDQPEAVAVILLDYDGVNPARLVDQPPTPQPGEAQHYG